jgi:diguanylate cyclase (GGDEF)-like protein
MRDMVGNLEAKVHDRTSELAEARDTLQRMVHELGEKNMALEVLSRTDRLTGIANRRKLEEALQTEVLRARRYGKPFSVIMVDVDHFKNVNDAYGHHTGDVVLNALAAKLALKARETDIVGRWGGEEFLIVCPETETAVGLALAERLRGEFSEGTIAEAGRVTCSFGVASFHLGDDMSTLIARADSALYRAKDNGRNRVEVEEKGS